MEIEGKIDKKTSELEIQQQILAITLLTVMNSVKSSKLLDAPHFSLDANEIYDWKFMYEFNVANKSPFRNEFKSGNVWCFLSQLTFLWK